MKCGLQNIAVGFTGTQKGMTEVQGRGVLRLLKQLSPTSFHHGDCIGADADAHDLAVCLNIPIIIHPPTKSSKRAFCHKRSSLVEISVLDEFDYLARNKHIVNDCLVLIAAPKGMEEELRSGTWSTVRYARKHKKVVLIVWPFV